jgi:catechol 2,3-dioxygenase-like lactoylglutathione lyase family enzyme
MSDSGAANAAVFEGVTPILRVQSLDASIAYYIQRLGFQLDWRGPYFASVSRARCHIFLCEGDQGNPGSWVWIGVDDAQTVYDEYRNKGAKLRHPPTNYEWAYEMQVEDLDGNVLRIGSDSNNEQPVGEWLDMRGDRWVQTAGGGRWVQAAKK